MCLVCMYPQGTQEQTIMTVVFLLQLWDIREGSCKQTFPGHESDINAVTVSLACMHGGIILKMTSEKLVVKYEWH